MLTPEDFASQAQIDVGPEVLTFGLGENSKCPIDTPVKDTINLTNNGRETRKFTFFVPADEYRFKCVLHPGYGSIKPVC